MSSSDASAYAGLARAFSSLGIRWYLFGAQAAILHGAARFTEDIDVTVDIGDMPARELVAALTKEGFRPRVSDAAFIEQTRVVPIVHDASGTPVDVVLAGPGIEELFFEELREMEIEGIRVPVARAEDIVTMKILAGRPKDLEDVASILAAQGADFDTSRTRRLLDLLEQALDQRDLLPLFAQALARASRIRP